ncbi:DUF4253 domain-containing protein [Pseudonocardia charpentierae]|uniref:DUF4253 domain-containing protein n=1 Tax=Pseudonocardia charpentierae TaxID=3075545 RepID=UPI0037CC0CD9
MARRPSSSPVRTTGRAHRHICSRNSCVSGSVTLSQYARRLRGARQWSFWWD